MRAGRLHSWEAWRQGWGNLWRNPGPLLGFSAAVLSLHLLGWGLFAAGEASDSGVLSALLHLLGLLLYSTSLIWMIEGLTRAGLTLARREPLSWGAFWPWPGQPSWRLIRSLLALASAAAAAALVSFASWSLLLLVLPGLSLAAALVGVIASTALAISQLFSACLALETRMGPAASLRTGVLLLERHGPGLLLLSALLLASLLAPLLAGLLAEALAAGLGVAVTALALVLSLPWIANSVAHAYLQLESELRLISPQRPAAR